MHVLTCDVILQTPGRYEPRDVATSGLHPPTPVGNGRTPLSSHRLTANQRQPCSVNQSASRRLLARSRRSISQPCLPKTPIAKLTPLLSSRQRRTPRRSAGRSPRGDTPIGRKRHKRQCAPSVAAGGATAAAARDPTMTTAGDSDDVMSSTPDLSLRYNPITHQTNAYDCSPMAMPTEPQFRADEYRDSPHSQQLQKAKSVNSLLYGSPSKPSTTPSKPTTPGGRSCYNDDNDVTLLGGGGALSDYDVIVGGGPTSTPVQEQQQQPTLQKAKSLTSVFANGEGELSRPTTNQQQQQQPTLASCAPTPPPSAAKHHQPALAASPSTPLTTTASPGSACALFLPIERPRDPPPAPPRAANALFQTEPLHG